MGEAQMVCGQIRMGRETVGRGLQPTFCRARLELHAELCEELRPQLVGQQGKRVLVCVSADAVRALRVGSRSHHLGHPSRQIPHVVRPQTEAEVKKLEQTLV